MIDCNKPRVLFLNLFLYVFGLFSNLPTLSLWNLLPTAWAAGISLPSYLMMMIPGFLGVTHLSAILVSVSDLSVFLHKYLKPISLHPLPGGLCGLGNTCKV